MSWIRPGGQNDVISLLVVTYGMETYRDCLYDKNYTDDDEFVLHLANPKHKTNVKIVYKLEPPP